MKRVNAIITHPVYREYYDRLEALEQERPFCRHQMTHLLDVARIAYIRSLENALDLDKEVIYAAALLHDIGKSLQYEKKIPHEISGVEIAERILSSLPAELSFSAEEMQMILTAIRGTVTRSLWKSCSMRATKPPGHALPARQSRNVTGVWKRKIWR